MILVILMDLSKHLLKVSSNVRNTSICVRIVQLNFHKYYVSDLGQLNDDAGACPISIPVLPEEVSSPELKDPLANHGGSLPIETRSEWTEFSPHQHAPIRKSRG